MGSIRTRKENGMLMFDFRYQGARCREQTTLPDTRENRQKMEKVLKRIEAEITLGTFDYVSYFPHSPLAQKFSAEALTGENQEKKAGSTPLFSAFAAEWYEENSVRWKNSYRKTTTTNLSRHLIPEFGKKEVSCITKAEVLKFRFQLSVLTEPVVMSRAREKLIIETLEHPAGRQPFSVQILQTYNLCWTIAS